MGHKFNGAEKRCIGLTTELKQVAEDFSTHFFDAGSVTPASIVDGVHLDKGQHQILGEAIAHQIFERLEPSI